MKKPKVAVLDKEQASSLIKFIGILSLSIVAPLFQIQMITGPMVNALLFIATIMLGPYSAILIGILPSAFALSVGLLPFAFAPMIPFIMIGNAILVLSFNYFQQRNYWLGISMAAVLKYSFLLIASQILISLFLKDIPVAKVASTMMAWPQLGTALIGGVIAYFFLKFIKKI